MHNHTMEKITSFTQLTVWQKGHALVLSVYMCSKKFPREELYSLTDQMRRAVVSITSNIAEGFSRTSAKEKVQFYSIALGSTTEIQNQLLIARDIGYLEKNIFTSLASESVEVQKMLHVLIKKIKYA